MAATGQSEGWFSCKGCVGSDPTQDTVKVNPALLNSLLANKENAQPLQQTKNSEQAVREQQLAEQRRTQAEADARQQAEERRQAHAQLAAQEIERQAAEQRQRQEEERQKAAARAAAAAAAAAVEADEERRQRVEAERAAMEQARLEQEAAEAEALAAAQEKVKQWCKSNGFRDMNSQKKTMRGATKFPLHTAVKHVNEEIVGLLLKCGANPAHIDSKKQTPCQLAEKLNKDGSHESILAMLR